MMEIGGSQQVGRSPVMGSHLNLKNDLCVEDSLEQGDSERGCSGDRAEGEAG